MRFEQFGNYNLNQQAWLFVTRQGTRQFCVSLGNQSRALEERALEGYLRKHGTRKSGRCVLVQWRAKPAPKVISRLGKPSRGDLHLTVLESFLVRLLSFDYRNAV
ncbi:MAG: hypothetical protein UV19_C0015G0007 [Parcubacteria group bacterium GW2011_GWA2_42_28]|nr:MAG: hypothetical protein UV19_C0015G0007 [Parcubacteria group bacterium GW2011_GWA2_42_28]